MTCVGDAYNSRGLMIYKKQNIWVRRSIMNAIPGGYQEIGGKKFNGFFGMFDILGYKDLIEHNNLDEIINIYYKNILNRDLLALAFGNLHTADISPSVEAKKLMFSDTFILYQDFDSQEDSIKKLQRAFAFMIYSSYFMRFAFEAGIPLRGALSFGEYYIDEKYICFLGKPVLEAHDESNKQNWCGAVICDSAMNVIDHILTTRDVEEYVRESQISCSSKQCDRLSDKDINELIIEYEIPYKDHYSKKCYHSKGKALRWDDFAARDIVGIVSDSININKEGGINGYQEIYKRVQLAFGAHKKMTNSSDVKEKIKETSKFLNNINNLFSKDFRMEKSILSFCPTRRSRTIA